MTIFNGSIGFHAKHYDLFNIATLCIADSALTSYNMIHLSTDVPHIKLVSAGEYFTQLTESTPH